MAEPMTVRVEVWPVAADEAGIWLVSDGDAWRDTLPVMADGDPHFDVEMLLSREGVLDDRIFMHSTSWRTERTSIMLTYMAVVRRSGLVRDNWPRALPISPNMAAAVGHPIPHGPNDPPTPRHVDVLLHGLRHIKFLTDPHGDTTAAQALSDPWPAHLASWEPALAGMYACDCSDHPL